MCTSNMPIALIYRATTIRHRLPDRCFFPPSSNRESRGEGVFYCCCCFAAGVISLLGLFSTSTSLLLRMRLHSSLSASSSTASAVISGVSSSSISSGSIRFRTRVRKAVMAKPVSRTSTMAL